MWFGSIYLIVMIIRYVVRMSLYPPERWTGSSIPIFFSLGASFIPAYRRPLPYSRIAHTAKARRRLDSGLSVTLIAVSLVVWIGYMVAPAIMANKLGSGRLVSTVRIDRSVAMRASDGSSLWPMYIARCGPDRSRTNPRAPSLLQTIETGSRDACRSHVAEHGYNVVMQGVRGRYESGGTFIPLVRERQDGIDTLHWLAKQPWFDAGWDVGGSYFGYTQWVLADQVHPGPSALLVQLSSTSFHDMLIGERLPGKVGCTGPAQRGRRSFRFGRRSRPRIRPYPIN